MVRFINEHRDEYGVEPICDVRPIAPSTYYSHKARAAGPSLRSARAQRDEALRVESQRVWETNARVYGVRELWHQLKRAGITVARCTVARLMDEMGLHGVVRGCRFKTTVSAEATDRPLDLVERDFSAARPNELWVSDLTYVATWRGFVYVAFVIDAFYCPRNRGKSSIPLAILPPNGLRFTCAAERQRSGVRFKRWLKGTFTLISQPKDKRLHCE
ncbi:IS3 family transposase [Rhodocaloribacter litoris]|nr:IS3 family transposase [Rhodocaloribacter litoris]